MNQVIEELYRIEALLEKLVEAVEALAPSDEARPMN
jgi:hypothetical protein